MHRESVLVAVLLLGASACRHSGGSTTPPSTEPSPVAEPVRVRVINHYKTEMEVSVTGSGATRRLGVVAPGLEREFDVPPAMVLGGVVTFLAHPSGYGPVVRSEELRIRAGDIVDFEIATNLVGSQAWVRP